MKNFKTISFMACLLLGMFVTAGCGNDDDDPMSGAKTSSDIEWAQHQYQVKCSGESWGEIKWDGLYASIYEQWTFNKGKKDGPHIFFSHYRWFPANYGPTYWTEKLDNGDWYYENRYSSHDYETKTLDGDKVEMTFEMQGRTWKGIMTDGNITLTTPDGAASVTLTRLPAKAYDGSYDDVLKEIL
jgi:hypothetical protein